MNLFGEGRNRVHPLNTLTADSCRNQGLYPGEEAEEAKHTREKSRVRVGRLLSARSLRSQSLYGAADPSFSLPLSFFLLPQGKKKLYSRNTPTYLAESRTELKLTSRFSRSRLLLSLIRHRPAFFPIPQESTFLPQVGTVTVTTIPVEIGATVSTRYPFSGAFLSSLPIRREC